MLIQANIIVTWEMKRYFYSGNVLAKKWLDSQYNLVRVEDQIFRDALLAALKLQPSKVKQFKNLRETILNMTIQQQSTYANNYHLEALFKIFDSLHRNSRGRKMIVRGKQSSAKQLVDPDKFPVWDLKRKPNFFYSIWNTIAGKNRYDIGHQLVVKNSLIQHHEGGKGVFLQLSRNKKQIQIGQFIGLVPGSIYQSYQSFKKIRLQSLTQYERTPQHLHFPSGKVLQLGSITQYDEELQSQIALQSFMINPYSLGQYINHPPYGKMPNVIFTQIQCKQNFFPSYFKKYLPYKSFLPIQNKKKQQRLRVFGIFACQPIKNKQQLYVDYCQNHIYPIDKIPQWMIQPQYPDLNSLKNQQINPSQLNFSKEQYEHPAPSYWRVLQNQALKKNQKLYENYLKTVKYRPNKVLYQDQEVKISAMNNTNKQK